MSIPLSPLDKPQQRALLRRIEEWAPILADMAIALRPHDVGAAIRSDESASLLVFFDVGPAKRLVPLHLVYAANVDHPEQLAHLLRRLEAAAESWRSNPER